MPELPEGVERIVLVRLEPGRDWEVADNAYVGMVPGVETKEAVLLTDLPKIEQAVVERIREALISEAALRAGWEAQDREIGYGLSRMKIGVEAALATLDQEEGDPPRG